MTPAEAKQRHTALCDEIRKHDHHYYALAQPLISDAAYDALYHELLDLEARFPELITADSPSRRSAPNPSNASSGTPSRDRFRMPDLAADPTAMSSEELRAYGEKCRSVRKRDFQQLLEDESRHRPEHTGFIYILSNPAMPGLLKIGSTSGPVEKRVSQLNSATGVPEPFRPEFIIPVYEGLKAAERKAHAALNIYRQHNRREFFKVPVDVARYLLEEALGEKAKLPHSRAASSRFRRR